MEKFTFKTLVICCVCVISLSCSNNQNKFNVELIPVKSGEKWGYINNKGEYKINPQFEDAHFFCDGLARVISVDGKVGYISKEGKYIIPAKFISGTNFSDGLAFVVSEGGHPTCINKSGETKFQIKQAKYVYSFAEGLALFSTKESKYGFVDNTGKVVVNPQFEKAHPFSQGFAAVKQNMKWGFIDKAGKIVINPQFDEVLDFYEGKATFFNGKQVGFIDTKGAYVINPQFDNANVFSEGFALIKQGKVFGYISENGEIEINPQFDSAGNFQSGFAVIEQGNRYGYINKKGEIQINPQFDNASSFFGNIAFVENAEKWGIIDIKGKYLVNPQFDLIKTVFESFSVISDFYDASDFISIFFKRASENSFDGFTANSTLQSIVDNSIYGNYASEVIYQRIVNCNNKQKINNDISISNTSFYFASPIYEDVTTYSNYLGYRYATGTSKQYNFSKKISAIKYQFELSGDAIDKGGSFANALKTEIESRYALQMVQSKGKYFVFVEDGKLSFTITYTDYSVSLFVGFQKENLQSYLNTEDEDEVVVAVEYLPKPKNATIDIDEVVAVD